MAKPPSFSLYNQDRLDDVDFVAGFIARSGVVDSLLATLRHIASGGPTEHQVLIGTRGMGKTSLLRRLAIAIKQDPILSIAFIPLRFREEQYNIISLDAFWRNCGESLAEYCEKEGNQALADRLDAAIETMEWRDAEKSRDAFLAACQEAGGRAILLLDNLDLILEGIKPEGNWLLRAALQSSGGPIVIGAATQLLAQGADRDAAFYEFFHPHMLEPLDERELLNCLNALADRRGESGAPVKELLAREPERIRSLYVLTGGNPRVLGLIYQLFEQAESDTIFADLEALLDQVTPFYKARIEEYQTPLQRAVIDGIALNWDPITSGALAKETGIEITTLSGQLNRLKKDGLIEEVETSGTKAGYQLSERFLNIWYLMRHGTRKTKQRLRWFTIFLSKLFSANELQRMAGDARDGKSKRWHPDHCEAVIEAYELKFQVSEPTRRLAIEDLISSADRSFQAGYFEDELAAYDEIVARVGASDDLDLQVQVALALVNKGDTLGELGRTGDAIAAYNEVLKRFDSSDALELQVQVAMALVNKGATLGELGRSDEAILAYDQVLTGFNPSLAPDLIESFAMALVNKGVALGDLGRFEDEIAIYDEVVTRFGSSDNLILQVQVAISLVNKGITLGRLQRSDDAIPVYDEVIARFGSSDALELQGQVAIALVNKGVRLGEIGQFNDAIRTCDEVALRFALIDDPDIKEALATALINKGITFSRLQRPNDAISAYDEVVALFGSSEATPLKEIVKRALINKGAKLDELGRLEDAIAVYEDIVAQCDLRNEQNLNEDLARALICKGSALGKLGRVENAIAAFDEVVARFGSNEAIELQKNVGIALVEKGGWCGEFGRADDAIAAYDEVVMRFGLRNDQILRACVSRALVRSGVFVFWNLDIQEEGIARLRRAINTTSDSYFAKANLLWMLLATGEINEAVELEMQLDLLDEGGRSLMLAGLDLVAKKFDISLDHLGDALEQGLDGHFDYSEDLLWYIRIAVSLGHGELLIEWFRSTSNADRYAPVFGALMAHVRGERSLLDLNPEVRTVAQQLYAKLAPRRTVADGTTRGRKPARKKR